MTAPILYPPSGAASALTILADFRDFDGLKQATAVTTAGWVAAGRGASLLAAGQQSWWNGSSGAGTDTDYLDAAGPCHRIIAPAGAGVQQTRYANAWDMPLWQDPTLWPASDTTRRRFTFSATVEMASAPTDVVYFVGLHNNTSVLASGGPGQSGVELAYFPAQARWRVRSRLTPLGALVNGATSGIGLAQRFRLAFRYTEATTPALDVLINGVILQTFSGVAALPVPAVLPFAPAGGNGGFQCIMGGGEGTIADGDLRVRRARYLVEEIAA